MMTNKIIYVTDIGITTIVIITITYCLLPIKCRECLKAPTDRVLLGRNPAFGTSAYQRHRSPAQNSRSQVALQRQWSAVNINKINTNMRDMHISSQIQNTVNTNGVC